MRGSSPYSGQMTRLEMHMRKVRALHRTAVIVGQMSATRFESAERVLNSFIRTRPALLKVIGTAPKQKTFQDNLFYAPASRRKNEKRTSSFLRCARNVSLMSSNYTLSFNSSDGTYDNFMLTLLGSLTSYSSLCIRRQVSRTCDWRNGRNHKL